MSDNPTNYFALTGAVNDKHFIKRTMAELPAIERDLDEIEARNRQSGLEWLKAIRPNARVDRAEIERRLGRRG